MSDFDRVIITDLETSGLIPGVNGILSIGAVELVGDESFYMEGALDPIQEINPESLLINGFSEEDCLDFNKPSQVSLVNSFYKWVEKIRKEKMNGTLAIIGGFNLTFDIGFLKKVKNSWPFQYRSFDLHAAALFKTGRSFSSKGLALELGVEPEPEIHNALQGALQSKRCYQALSRL